MLAKKIISCPCFYLDLFLKYPNISKTISKKVPYKFK
jgi:hypothetical protein